MARHDRSYPKEGSIPFTHERVISSDLIEARDVRVIERYRVELFRKGLIGYYEAHRVGYGNLSMRLKEPNENSFHITGTKTGFIPDLAPTHYARVMGWDLEEKRVSYEGESPPSSDTLLHATFYDLDHRIRGVVHVHHERMWLYYEKRLEVLNSEIEHQSVEELKEIQRLYEETDFGKSKVLVMGNHKPGLLIVGSSGRESVKRTISYLDRMESS